MKLRILAPLLLLGSTVGLKAQTTPPQPWFSEPLTRFFETSQVTSLGWSRDGKTALFVPVDAGGRGGAVVRMMLIDAVEDRVLVDQDQWGDEFDLPAEEPGLLARGLEQSPAGKAFIEACLDAGIQPADPAVPATPFPLKNQGSTITARAIAVPLGATDDTGSQPLDYRIVVVSEGRGEKTIFRSQVSHAFDVTVEGYIPSPFEPRMVVVYGVTQPGFEGERPKTYGFSGCHLKIGFTKK